MAAQKKKAHVSAQKQTEDLPTEPGEVLAVGGLPQPKGKKKTSKNAGPTTTWTRSLWIGSGVVVLILVVVWFYAFKANFQTTGGQTYETLTIRSGMPFDSVVASLRNRGLIMNEHTFRVVAAVAGYPLTVKSGKYRIAAGASNARVVFSLRNGMQEPVRLSFQSVRTKERLAEKLTRQLEMRPSELLALLDDSERLQQFREPDDDPRLFQPDNIIAVFIPDTYEAYWNVSADGLLRQMLKSYRRFWTEERKKKAAEIGLTPREVSVLASIVEAETQKNDEKARIAGVYMNRLQGKLGPERVLNADPTVIFGLGDFTITRLLRKHTAQDTPYNTYLHGGLPPGPINCPTVSSLEAVLNYERHDYVYFCAREDFSGYHRFADNERDHINNANRYQRALDAWLRTKKNREPRTTE